MMIGLRVLSRGGPCSVAAVSRYRPVRRLPLPVATVTGSTDKLSRKSEAGPINHTVYLASAQSSTLVNGLEFLCPSRRSEIPGWLAWRFGLVEFFTGAGAEEADIGDVEIGDGFDIDLAAEAGGDFVE